MKIVIIGYGEMLQSLIKGVMNTKHEIIGVLRHENIKLSSFKLFIKDIFAPSIDYNFIKLFKLKEIKANSVNSKKFIKTMNLLKPDIILVGSWSEKFSLKTINSAKKGCINIHPSLLPKYRGPNPYLQVILNNETKTGITFHLMDENYDTGNILYQSEVDILPNDNGQTLKNRCCNEVQIKLPDFLNNIDEFLSRKITQNPQNSSYQRQISLKETILDFEKETSYEIDRRIRALTPWINCYICYKNEFFSFEKHEIIDEFSSYAAASVINKSKDSISIVCKDKKIIQFSKLKINRPFSKIITRFYIKNIIKINSQAL